MPDASPPPAPADDGATIYYARDGYDPEGRGINGRRVAGASFLRGYLAHRGPGALRACVDGPEAERDLRGFCARHAPDRPLRVLHSYRAEMTGAGTLVYPAPSLSDLAFARMARGSAAWSLCGVTHTLSTRAVMAQIAALVTAPVEPWDALICTSRAVKAAVETQLDAAEAFARARFGGRTPPRPALPVIPLGIDSESFAPDSAQGAALRSRLGLGTDDSLVMTLSRLSFAEKFDPLPFFLALRHAAEALAADRPARRLHLALTGVLSPGVTADQYRRAAAALMPQVRLHILDGSRAEERQAALSGADIFAFPIDNIQETFGLAPVEAMAAGLPVVATDWDGLRDTVTPDCGMLVPTLAASGDHSRVETLRYLTGTDSYHQFLSMASALTAYDPQRMGAAIATLARDADLRARLGAAGQARARAVFDWAVVIPRLQELWRWQNTRRAADDPRAHPPAEPPVMPSVFTTYAAWPTAQIDPPGTLRLAATATALPGCAEMARLRGFDRLKRMTEKAELIETVRAALPRDGTPITTQALAHRLNLAPTRVDRAALWLIKYGYARPC